MSLIADLINHPITLDGKDIVIVPDLVGPVPVTEQHQYVELLPAGTTCPAISVRETDIEDIREQYPGLPVYGLWQVLVHSNAVSFRQPLHVVKINELDGYYLVCDLGRAEFSGVYEAGFFAADSNFALDEANDITPDTGALRIPPKEAKLASELQAERRLRAQKSWRTLGIATIWIVILAVVVDFGFETFYMREQRKLQTKTAMLESLRSGLDRLRNSRLSEVPNDIEAIKKIAALWAEFPDIRTAGEVSFAGEEFTFRLADQGFDPKDKVPGLDTQYHPQGYWLLSLTNPSFR